MAAVEIGVSEMAKAADHLVVAWQAKYRGQKPQVAATGSAQV